MSNGTCGDAKDLTGWPTSYPFEGTLTLRLRVTLLAQLPEPGDAYANLFVFSPTGASSALGNPALAGCAIVPIVHGA